MVELKIKVTSPEFAATIISVFIEKERAERLHPVWPTDNVKGAALVLEEAGESIKEANNIDEGKGSLKDLKNELIQTAAVTLRMLEEINKQEQELIQMYGEYMGEV